MNKFYAILLITAVACLTAGVAQAAHSDHGCNNCHMPHRSGDATDAAAYGVPLWSTAQQLDGLPVFELYTSRKFAALTTDIGQPDGPSKMCLGCHDGTYGWISDSLFEAGDLANSHPVSFTYDSALATATNGGLKDPSEDSGLGGSIAWDLLDDQGKMQCTSCHDVHTSGFGDYLLKYDIDAASEAEALLCRSCHNK